MRLFRNIIPSLLAIVTFLSCSEPKIGTENGGEKQNEQWTIRFKINSTNADFLSDGDVVRFFVLRKPQASGENHICDLGNLPAHDSGTEMTFEKSVVGLDRTASQIFAIYPDRGISYNALSESSGHYNVYIPIDIKQSGDASRHSYYTSCDGLISVDGRVVLKQPSFKQSTSTIRFRLNPDKDIMNIRIRCSSFIAGDKIAMHTDETSIKTECTSLCIMLHNGGIIAKAGEPTPLSFASAPISKGCTLTFELTATDGTVSTSIAKVVSDIKSGMEYDVTDLELGQWEKAPKPENEFETAIQAISHIGLGTSLCNSFEIGIDFEKKGASRENPKSFECLNARTETTQKTMDALSNAGFGCVRLPVTWYHHMDNINSDIDEVWLDRIEEVVNYALNDNMYVIINVHHDTGAYATSWLRADYNSYQNIRPGFINIWGQIARRFEKYDQRVLFEGYNEILDTKDSWKEPTMVNAYTTANLLNQDFVDAVRSSSGNNLTRNLIVSTYATSTTRQTLESFAMPCDVLPGHLMVQVHSYLPSGFCTSEQDKMVYEFRESDIAEIDAMFALLTECLQDKGYPVIMGEYGAFRTAKRSETDRGHHAAVYTRKCLERGIAPIFWYCPCDYQERKDGLFLYEELKDSLVTSYKNYMEKYKNRL